MIELEEVIVDFFVNTVDNKAFEEPTDNGERDYTQEEKERRDENDGPAKQTAAQVVAQRKVVDVDLANVAQRRAVRLCRRRRRTGVLLAPLAFVVVKAGARVAALALTAAATQIRRRTERNLATQPFEPLRTATERRRTNALRVVLAEPAAHATTAFVALVGNGAHVAVVATVAWRFELVFALAIHTRVARAVILVVAIRVHHAIARRSFSQATTSN